MEQTIRDLKAGGLAHVPSGKFSANAAWLGLACLAHNFARWTLRAAGPPGPRRPCPPSAQAWRPCRPAWSTAADNCACARPPTWKWRDAFHSAMITIRGLAVPI